MNFSQKLSQQRKVQLDKLKIRWNIKHTKLSLEKIVFMVTENLSLNTVKNQIIIIYC